MSSSLSSLSAHIKAIAEGEYPPRKALEECFDTILEGKASEVQIAAFLTALKMRGETPDDITAGASILRKRALVLDAPDGTMDIVGTGGDNSGSWNISTAAAIVLAGCGVPIAKHGNRAISSKSGAADVLLSLGVNLDASLEQLKKALTEAYICFLMAPNHHSAMRHVAPIRAELGYRTIFNMLGPLSNPALVKRILVGVFDRKWLLPFAEALKALGTTHAMVVHGEDGLDEVTSTGVTHAVRLLDGKITELTISPEDAGLKRVKSTELVGSTPEKNAEALLAMLKGEKGAYRDIVILNAGVALFAGGYADTIMAGAEKAAQSIDTEAALTALEMLIRITNEAQ